jgi:hypothetical protein
MALNFANCFLEKTRRKTYPCNDEDELWKCTEDMTADAYATYTEFFTHTQNMCYFLQSQIWQERTDNTINKLADTSESVAQQIEEANKVQNEVLEKQNQALQNQEVYIKRGLELKKIFEDSSHGVQKMLTEFKDSTSEQRALIFEVFDRVTLLHSMVMGEFTGFYSLIFYVLSIIITYLLTATPRTSAARFLIFVIMTVNIVAERMIVYYGADKQLDKDGNLLDEGVSRFNYLFQYTAVHIIY